MDGFPKSIESLLPRAAAKGKEASLERKIGDIAFQEAHLLGQFEGSIQEFFRLSQFPRGPQIPDDPHQALSLVSGIPDSGVVVQRTLLPREAPPEIALPIQNATRPDVCSPEPPQV